MNKILLPFVLLFLTANVQSQNVFKGLVVEEDTSMNVTDAIVSIEGTALAKKTDANGAFNFSQNLPNGEHVVTIEKEGYVTKYLLIEVSAGKNVIMDNIKIEVTKDERKRREKALKEQKKQEKKAQKEKEKLLAKAKKEKEKRDKELEKKKKKLQKENKNKKEEEVIIAPIEEEKEQITKAPEVTSIQIKYGMKLDVTPETLTNKKLYEFIQEWEGTDYLLGGETEAGIDCSSFTQRLYTAVYDKYIERTAEKQFDSELTNKFLGKEYLEEGDLIFFKGSGEFKNTISHVGVYLHNGKFVHATSYTKDNGIRGVKISELDNSFWKKRFVAGGKRPKR
ncbi:NlpC/P60 family protein [Lacinutrix salivirga]